MRMSDRPMLQWLRRRFITGFFVTVPLIISVATLWWSFRIIDGFMGPVYARWLGREVPGLGLLTTVALVLVVGSVATNVIGRRFVQQAEGYLLRIPVFRTVYAPLKQLTAAFSPDNDQGLKRVVMVQDRQGRAVLGFLTREFVVDRGQGPEPYVAVYVPTNNLYLGDVVFYPKDAAFYPALTVEEGIRIFLTGGMAMSGHLKGRRADDPEGTDPL
jgi:uncharacterized membrane protein